MSIPYNHKKINTLHDVSVEGKEVFLRVDYNVPMENGIIEDDTRIRATLPTLKFLLEAKANILIASHLGRPKGKVDEKYSLLPVAEKLRDLLHCEVLFPDDSVGDGVKRVLKERKLGSIVMLENLRFHPEEEKNDSKFALQLKNGCDVYVTDAFGALHRAHASTDALPRKMETKAVGFLVEKELQFLTPLLEGPKRPFGVILGGAKVSDKIKIIEKLIPRIDALFLGGAMVFTFMQAMGKKTGKSLVEPDQIQRVLRILDDAKNRNVKMYFPEDFQLGNSVEDPGTPFHLIGTEIPADKMGLDIGPKTVESFSRGFQTLKTIFWNGPMGLFEKPPFDEGTVKIANSLSNLHAIRVVGGGDSISALHRAGVAEKMDHVSTGGGATLEFLEGRSLPGLESLAV